MTGTVSLGQQRPIFNRPTDPERPIGANPQAASVPHEVVTMDFSSDPEIITAGQGFRSYSYSGCDIKLIVHLPTVNNDTVDFSGTTDQIQENQSRIVALEEELSTAQSRAESRTDLETQRQETQRDLNIKETEYGGAGTAEEREELLAEAMALSQELEEIDVALSALGRSERVIQAELDAALEVQEALDAPDQGPPMPGTRTKVLSEIQTLSISIHREKFPVRTLGSVYPRSFTRGGRNIAGSMVYVPFVWHPFAQFFENSGYRSTGVGDWDHFRWTTYITDQLPPLDISICFNNEYGNSSWMGIFGLEFINEGQVMSIEDIFMEGTAQWVARDIDLLRGVMERPYTRSAGVGEDTTGSSLLHADRLRNRVAGRRNPFI